MYTRKRQKTITGKHKNTKTGKETYEENSVFIPFAVMMFFKSHI